MRGESRIFEGFWEKFIVVLKSGKEKETGKMREWQEKVTDNEKIKERMTDRMREMPTCVDHLHQSRWPPCHQVLPVVAAFYKIESILGFLSFE